MPIARSSRHAAPQNEPFANTSRGETTIAGYVRCSDTKNSLNNLALDVANPKNIPTHLGFVGFDPSLYVFILFESFRHEGERLSHLTLTAQIGVWQWGVHPASSRRCAAVLPGPGELCPTQQVPHGVGDPQRGVHGVRTSRRRGRMRRIGTPVGRT